MHAPIPGKPCLTRQRFWHIGILGISAPLPRRGDLKYQQGQHFLMSPDCRDMTINDLVKIDE